MEHNFNVDIAKTYGVHEAIFIHNLYFWILKNECNGRHYYEGRSWTYNSLTALEKLFPYFTRRQIRTVIDNCVKKGAVIKGNFNKDGYDKTNWFALSEDVLRIYRGYVKNDITYDKNVTGNYAQNSTTYATSDTSYAQKGTPIPDSKPDSKPDKDILPEADALGQPPAITLPLNGGGEHPVSQRQAEEWRALYPAVDVMQELRKMRGWLLANPRQRKTRNGILRFANSWLAREQDKGHKPGQREEWNKLE